MRILHYFLGFPPYRTGGLTKFCIDLMDAQVKNGDVVGAIWPGKINIFKSNKVKIVKHTKINNVYNFEIINPLPVSLDEGIKDVKAYMKKCNPKEYIDFIEKYKPDVVHFHTLMGLHKEFIDILKKRNIKTIFTTHDYFGICPKVTLYRFGKICNNDNNCKNCVKCNSNALSINMIRIMQSNLYRKVKNSFLFKILRAKHRNKFFLKNESFNELKSDEQIVNLGKEYKLLRNFYIDMLQSFNMIHFNSSLAKDVYSRYINIKNYKVITISHKNIADNRNIERVNSNTYRYTFLAAPKPFKGFEILKSSLDSIYEKRNINFILNVYGNVEKTSPYMIIHKEGFSQDNLKNILSNTDIVFAPSLWYETFGLTVLESISYGVPVVVSDNVGAKEIIGSGGIIIRDINKNSLQKVIEELTKDKIELLRNGIKELELKKWDEFVEEMKSLYKS